METVARILDQLGEDTTLALGGLAIGALFGFFAQRARFCLRAAVIEVARMQAGPRLAVWLLAFAAALVLTQGLILAGVFDTANVRQLSSPGSLSGPIIGGLLFGIGMVLARGCSSRLLVLAANGNLRALLSGLIFAVTAQASMDGILSPWREALGTLWTIEGGSARDLLALSGLGNGGGLAFGLVWLVAGLWLARRSGIGARIFCGRDRRRADGGLRLAIHVPALHRQLLAHTGTEPVLHQSLGRRADAGAVSTRRTAEL